MTFDFDSLLRSESAGFLEAIDATDPAAAVPSCPEWSAHDLLWHLAEVQHFWAAIVGGGMTDPTAYAEPTRPDPDEFRQFFVDAHEALMGALAGADDGDAAWSWFGADQTAGFTRRRQVHEALIHRVDAELSAGLSSEMDPDLAADGVDEVLRIFFGGAPEWAQVSAEGPIGAVRCTDVGRQWLVQVQSFAGTSPNTGTTYTDEPVLAVVESGDPAFDISGAAPDLNRWLWSRFPVGPVTLDGTTAPFEAIVAQGMQ